MERSRPLAGKKLITLIMVVLSLVAAAGLFRQAASKAVPVEVATVEEQEVRRTIAASGYFAAAKEKELFARYPMLVKRVLVEAGERVQKGQVLLQGDTAELEAEKESLQADLAAVEAEITGLEKTLPLRMAEAESGVLAARQAYEQARREAAAAEALYEAGASPEMEFRQAQARLAAAEAELRHAEAGLGETRTLAATLAGKRERARAIRARLDLAEEKLSALQVRAPEDGRVAEVTVKEGAVVAAGAPLLLLQTPGLLVQGEVLAQDAPALRLGQRAFLTGELLAGRRVPGTLTKIHPRAVEKVSELGIKQRRVPVEVALSEQVAGMQPGYPVEVEIVVAEKKALAVPRKAIFALDGRQYVFRLREGRAVLSAVKCGLEGDDYVEVVSGLQPGETVIVDPPKEVGDGVRVRPKNL